MKKSLTKILARMAKDGDIETVAEIIEEMLEPEAPAENAAEEVVIVETPKGEAPTAASGGNPVEAEVIRNEQSPQCGAATIENAETTIVVDEGTLGEVISRLDQIIALLTPAAAGDEDVSEEIAEAVEEAVEAALEEEVAVEAGDPGIVTGEEIGEMIEEILDPVSEVVEENELNRARTAGEQSFASRTAHEIDGCGEEEQEVIASGDALKAALRAVAPALMKMPKKQRTRVCSDIAARLRGKSGRRGADGIYAALADTRRIVRDPKALGRRIMASRSANRPRT